VNGRNTENVDNDKEFQNKCWHSNYQCRIFKDFSSSSGIRVIYQKSRNSSWERKSKMLIVSSEGGNLLIDGDSWLPVKTAIDEIKNERDK